MLERDTKATEEATELMEDDTPAVDDEEAQMMRMMGFGGFESTAGKHVAGADASAADVHKKVCERRGFICVERVSPIYE
jgi:U4/U6.U5 tri-snRNP-associated protein 3